MTVGAEGGLQFTYFNSLFHEARIGDRRKHTARIFAHLQCNAWRIFECNESSDAVHCLLDVKIPQHGCSFDR